MLPDLTILNGLVNLLAFLVLVSAGVEEFVEQLKPWILRYLPKLADGSLSPDMQNVFQGAIFVSRFVAGLLTILVLGGSPLLVGLLPWLNNLPDFAPALLSAFLLGFGSGVIHDLKEVLIGLGNRINPPPPGA